MSHGESHMHAKLNDAAVRNIRRGVAAGAPMKALAAKYSVDDSTISRVVARERWGHVE